MGKPFFYKSKKIDKIIKKKFKIKKYENSGGKTFARLVKRNT